MGHPGGPELMKDPKQQWVLGGVAFSYPVASYCLLLFLSSFLRHWLSWKIYLFQLPLGRRVEAE